VPREALATLDLRSFVAHSSWTVPTARLSSSGWDLEPSGVADLLAKIKQAGVPLREYLSTSPLWGIKTGYNEAFLIDQQTRDRLIAEDPKCDALIRKYLRGRDIQRWYPQWGGQWMIVLRAARTIRGRGPTQAIKLRACSARRIPRSIAIWRNTRSGCGSVAIKDAIGGNCARAIITSYSITPRSSIKTSPFTVGSRLTTQAT